jgi:hypothetical protein
MTKARSALRIVTLALAFLFLASACFNLGLDVPLGNSGIAFSSPSTSIAEFEVLIGAFLLASALVSSLYGYAGAYILAAVGIAEGLLSPAVQGEARTFHELMVPFAVFGISLMALEALSGYRSGAYRDGESDRQLLIALQFFVGGLVTLGGLGFARTATFPYGTALGVLHLFVGLGGLVGGYSLLRRMAWSKPYVRWVNWITIAYSAFSEALAQGYALMPPGVGDALIGTIVAIIVSLVVIYLLPRAGSEGRRFEASR